MAVKALNPYDWTARELDKRISQCSAFTPLAGTNLEGERLGCSRDGVEWTPRQFTNLMILSNT